MADQMPPILTKVEEEEELQLPQEEVENNSVELNRLQLMMKQMGKKLEGVGDSIKESVKAATEGIKASGRTLGEDLTTGLMGPLRLVMEPFGLSGKSIFEGFGKGISKLRETFGKSSEVTEDLSQDIGETLKEEGEDAFEEKVLEGIEDVSEDLSTKLDDLTQAVLDQPSNLAEMLPEQKEILGPILEPLTDPSKTLIDSETLLDEKESLEPILKPLTDSSTEPINIFPIEKELAEIEPSVTREIFSEKKEILGPLLPSLGESEDEGDPERLYPRRQELLRKGGVEGAAAVYMVDSLLKEGGIEGDGGKEEGGLLDMLGGAGGIASLVAILGPLLLSVLPILLPILLGAAVIAAMIAVIPWDEVASKARGEVSEILSEQYIEAEEASILYDKLLSSLEDREELSEILSGYAQLHGLQMDTLAEQDAVFAQMIEDRLFLRQQLNLRGIDPEAILEEVEVIDPGQVTNIFAGERAPLFGTDLQEVRVPEGYVKDERTGEFRRETAIDRYQNLAPVSPTGGMSGIFDSPFSTTTTPLSSGSNPLAPWETRVDDAIITNDGQIIHTDPEDSIIATKNPISKIDAKATLTQSELEDFTGEQFGSKIHEAILKLLDALQKKEFTASVNNISQSSPPPFDVGQFRFRTVN